MDAVRCFHLELESLLKTEYHTYGHSETGKTTVACEKSHVPTHIQEHIDYIISGIKLFAGKRRPNPNSDLEKRGCLFPPLLKSLA
ncbi:hypothetical protein F5882DRAFT_462873 [Hyaloscypha sp. PMI_1271]|nr:hypothetical protein F5882DRAFT_462873 [Hyaloscypha sp. PMI_1271]